jgi:short subunit fatty acids transporter
METEILRGDIATVRNQLNKLVKESVKEVISLTQSTYESNDRIMLVITILYRPFGEATPDASPR